MHQIQDLDGVMPPISPSLVPSEPRSRVQNVLKNILLTLTKTHCLNNTKLDSIIKLLQSSNHSPKRKSHSPTRRNKNKTRSPH